MKRVKMPSPMPRMISQNRRHARDDDPIFNEPVGIMMKAMKKMIMGVSAVMAGLVMIANGAAQQVDRSAPSTIESPQSSRVTNGSAMSGKKPSEWMTASDYQTLDELNRIDGSIESGPDDAFVYDTLDWNELESARPFQTAGSTRLSIVEQLDNLVGAMAASAER